MPEIQTTDVEKETCGMCQSVEDELKKLNSESFQAEDNASREPLGRILADDFRIARSNYVIEDKPTMLNRVTADASRRKRDVHDENVNVYGDGAVVTSRVTLKEESGEVVGRFWNTKVFVMREGEWKCLVWQVARIP
jgi:hypothetical protein